MAATGAIAAAMGLSGPAAGMAMMAAHEMNEPVAKVSFDLAGQQVEGLLWAWPFKEGDEITVIGSCDWNGIFVALAAIDEVERVVVLPPHVTAGRGAHWKRVACYSLYAGLPVAGIAIAAACVSLYATEVSIYKLIPFLALGFFLIVAVMLWIGYRIGSRFSRFTRVAEEVFSAIGWKNVAWINLRLDSKIKRRPLDPHEMGDRYFRY